MINVRFYWFRWVDKKLYMGEKDKICIQKANNMAYIDAKELTLENFLKILRTNLRLILSPQCHFPTKEMLDKFLETINERSEFEVKEILSALMLKNGSFGQDEFYYKFYKQIEEAGQPESFQDLRQTEYYKRLMRYEKDKYNVWEGLTWVLDLLPHFPNEALRALDAYFLANCQFMPDDYLVAFGDWSTIIRAKFVEVEVPQQIFLEMLPREFEYLIAELYQRMGYNTSVTKSSYDGGVDVIAKKGKTGKREIILIQCKRYRNKIGVNEIRTLNGVRSHYKANKAVLVTCTDFTREAKKLADKNPVELIGLSDLTTLLNLHLGTQWIVKRDQYIVHQKKKQS